MAAFSLPPASTLEQHEMGHGVLRIVAPEGSEKPQRKRNAPRSRIRKPTEEINFLAQLEQRGVQGLDVIARQDDGFPLDHFFAPDQRLSTPAPTQRISAPIPAGKRSRPQAEPSKRTRPPAKKAKPQGEPRLASQRQRGVLLVKPPTRPTRGSLVSLSVKPGPDAAVGDDSATESEGQMVRRGMALPMELRGQGGAAAATAVGGGKSSSGTSHTVSSSGNDPARAQATLERKKAMKGIAASYREECVQLSRTVLALQRQWKQELQTPHPGLGAAEPLGENGSATPQAPKSRPRDKRVVLPVSRRKPASRTIVTYDPTRNLIAEV